MLSLHLDDETTATLARLERQLVPTRPQDAGFAVLDAGEVSLVLTHPTLPGVVVKRISGFPSPNIGDTYAALVHRYVDALALRGVPALASPAVCVPGRSGSHAVYVVQTRLPAEELGKAWLASADQDGVAAVVGQVAAYCEQGLTVHAGHTCGIDAQPSNWQIRDGVVVGLVDVTTPLFGVDGALEMDVEVILRSFPGIVRPFIRRTRRIESLFATHLSVRSNVRDFIANLRKEGRQDLIPAAVTALNAWLGERGLDASVTEAEVDDYYRRNAASLELSSRVRRLDLQVHRMFRLPYHATVPPTVERHR